MLVEEAARRQDDAVRISRRIFNRVLQRESRTDVIFGDETTVDMTRPNSQLQHHRSVARFRKSESPFDGIYDRGQIRARIQKPHLGFHGKGVGALLHDAGAFAVILADDNQRSAHYTAGSEIREGVRRDIGAHGGLKCNCTAQWIVNRCS